MTGNDIEFKTVKRGETLQNRRSDQRAKQNPEISGSQPHRGRL